MAKQAKDCGDGSKWKNEIHVVMSCSVLAALEELAINITQLLIGISLRSGWDLNTLERMSSSISHIRIVSHVDAKTVHH